MALEQTDWYYDYANDPGLTIRMRRENLARVGINDDDAGAWAAGYARLWLDDPSNPYVYGRKVAGTPTLNSGAQRAEQVNSWQEFTPEEKRGQIRADIDNQVFAPSGTQLVEDAFAARAVESTSAGASERRSDLEDTADGALDSFNPAIVPTPLDGSGFVEAKQTAFIDVVDPWVSEPDNVYALVVLLEVLTDTGDEGASARAHMFGPRDGPAGAVMTFTRDAGNPKVWRSQSQLGRYWADPNLTASMRLLWDNGSLPVDSTKELQGYGDRDYSVVRAGAP